MNSLAGASAVAGWPPATAGAPAALVDAHVHFHDCFDPDSFLDGAARNFRQAAAALGLPSATPGCLLFAEMKGKHAFRRFQAEAGKARSGPWRFEETEEDASLVARRPGDEGPPLVLVAGRQIQTYERLEVLALATSEDFLDGLSLGGTVERVYWSGALPVVPWGFGKWWGERGALVERILSGPEREAVFLGDNAGRPALAPRPSLFRLAEDQGVPVLPGSDPLPLPEHAGRAGSYGLVVGEPLDLRRPAAFLAGWIRRLRQSGQSDQPGASPRWFGRCRGLVDFWRDQSALHLRGQGSRKAG